MSDSAEIRALADRIRCSSPSPEDRGEASDLLVILNNGCELISKKNDEMQVLTKALTAEIERLRAALTELLDRHCELVNSGDCGNWDAETEPQVIKARAALNNQQRAQEPQRCAECACDDPPSQCDWIRSR